MKNKNQTYTVRGDVRGTISHHRTLSGAFRSMRRDERACASLGGGAYSDAEIERADGTKLSEDECEDLARMRERE